MELMGARISYVRDVEIYGEGEPAEYLYKMLWGQAAKQLSSSLLSIAN